MATKHPLCLSIYSSIILTTRNYYYKKKKKKQSLKMDEKNKETFVDLKSVRISN